MTEQRKVGGHKKGGRRGNGAGGEGWGGPAKGATQLTPQPFAPGNGGPAAMKTVLPEVKAERRATKLERAERMLEIIDDLAEHAKHEETRLAAAVKYRAEVIGQPIQRNINYEAGDVSELDDRQLDAELERARAAVIEGKASPVDPPGPPDVVH